MDSDIQKFFELFIGYDGETWSVDHAKKHHQGVHSYFLYDMEKMIENQVGYPSLLYLMNTVAFLGYCLKFDQSWKIPKTGREKENEFKDAGRKDDFEDFCNKYLGRFNDAYSKLAYLLFDLARHRLSHTFFTHNYVTTHRVSNHLKIEEKGSDYPHIWISVSIFFEDTKKAIELIYKELDEDQDKARQFSEKQKFILEWAWERQKMLNNIDLENSDRKTFPSDYPSNGVSGVPYTPPPETL